MRPVDTPMPPAIERLPRDHRGYPVPWFVAKVRGAWDFRVMGEGKIAQAIRNGVCWICGQPGLAGRPAVFVIGPMCVVNRVSAEPPAHRECAEYAARACPFLSIPKVKRNERDMPPEAREAAGIAIKRNPGVTALYESTTWRTFPAGPPNGGILFDVGEPDRVDWWSRGRPATRREVDDAIATGLPQLERLADLDGPMARRELQAQLDQATRLLPQEATR